MPTLTKRFIGRPDKYAVSFEDNEELKVRLISHIMTADRHALFDLIGGFFGGTEPEYKKMNCCELLDFLNCIDDSEQYEIFL